MNLSSLDIILAATTLAAVGVLLAALLLRLRRSRCAMN